MNNKTRSSDKFTRREFIGRTSAAAAGLIILPSHVIGGLGHTAPSDKLNIAAIGIGGKGKGQPGKYGGAKYSCIMRCRLGLCCRGIQNLPKSEKIQGFQDNAGKTKRY